MIKKCVSHVLYVLFIICTTASRHTTKGTFVRPENRAIASVQQLFMSTNELKTVCFQMITEEVSSHHLHKLAWRQ